MRERNLLAIGTPHSSDEQRTFCSFRLGNFPLPSRFIGSISGCHVKDARWIVITQATRRLLKFE